MSYDFSWQIYGPCLHRWSCKTVQRTYASEPGTYVFKFCLYIFIPKGILNMSYNLSDVHFLCYNQNNKKYLIRLILNENMKYNEMAFVIFLYFPTRLSLLKLGTCFIHIYIYHTVYSIIIYKYLSINIYLKCIQQFISSEQHKALLPWVRK